METIVSKESRYYWMGIAILAVIFFHVFLFGNINNYYASFFISFFSNGNIGVDIFFFLSSYGLCYSYKNNSLINYYFNRLLRIFPIYIVSLFVLCYLIKGNYLFVCFEQLTGIATIRERYTEWYIPALLLLYYFFPLLFKFFERYSNTIVPYIVLTVFIFGFGFVSKYIHHLFVARFPIIIMGILLYFNGKESFLKYAIFLTVLQIAVSHQFFGWLPLLLYAINVANVKLRFFSLLSYLGRHSLELYLSQHIGFTYFSMQPVKSFSVTLIGFLIFGGMFVLLLLLNSTISYCSRRCS